MIKKWKIKSVNIRAAIINGLIVVFGSLLIFFLQRSCGITKDEKRIVLDSFSVTVLVHGKNGKNDRILKDQGKVVIDFGSTREEEEINSEGEATFKELPIKYLNDEVFISIVHPQPYYPTKIDSTYLLRKDKSIYLEVELKGLNKVFGLVKNFKTSKPIDSVRVSYQGLVCYTDEFGFFDLNIPLDKQAKFIRLNFYKDGYLGESLDSIAPHTKQEIGMLLKQDE